MLLMISWLMIIVCFYIVIDQENKEIMIDKEISNKDKGKYYR